MNAAPEYGAALRQSSPRHDYHQQHEPNAEYQHFPGGPGGPGGAGQQQQQQQQQQQDLTIDGIPNNFPHRRSRASRTFKNPPQPHMCIKEKTLDGKEVFINVLSWTRIANPDNPDAPIPLYGGMKVGKIPPGSPKVPPLVYAVMASPEVLKKAGRKCPDTPERMNLVDLMCEFVEAMNPSLHLSRKPEILKDRDLSGELKDVWSAVQACRDKCRTDNGPPENLVVYTEFGPDSAPSYEHTIQQHQQQFPQHHQQQNDYLPNALVQQQYEQQQQQNRFPSSSSSSSSSAAATSPSMQRQSMLQPQHNQQQQSAISNSGNISSSSNPSVTSIEPNSATGSFSTFDTFDGAVNGNTTSRPPSLAATGAATMATSDDELARDIEGLKLSASVPAGGGGGDGGGKTNGGLTLPTTEPSVTTTASITVPQTSPTAAAAPVTPVKEPKSSSGHTFFPMFRSSKNSSNSNGSGNAAHTTGGGQSQQNALSNATGSTGVVASNGAENGTDGEQTKPTGTPVPTTVPAKSSTKKSGLNFFRRNKSSSSSGDKKEPSTPTKQQGSLVTTASGSVLPAAIPPVTAATPAATGAPSDGKLLLAGDLESGVGGGLSHRADRAGAGVGGGHHAYHGLETGTGASSAAEIVESSATIVAK